MRLYKYPLGGYCSECLIRISKGAYNADSPTDHIESTIRIMRVSVRKMCEVHTCGQFPLRMKLPVQDKPQIDVCIDFRTDNLILRII